LKAKKQDRNLRELFRHKLENAEIIPDPSVGETLMRKLAVREFLHFNPGRFNIYYTAGIIAAGIAAALILTADPGKKNNAVPQKILKEAPVNDSSESKIILPDSVPEARIAIKAIRYNATVRKTSDTRQKTGDIEASVPEKVSPGKNETTPVRVNESLKGTELFKQTSADNFKLKERSAEGKQIFESSVTEGCAPLRVIFRSTLTENDSCLWTFGDGGSSWNKEPEWIYDVDGEYRVVLKVFGPDGIRSSSPEVISVYPKPSARFEIFPDKVIIPEDEVRFQNYSAGAVKYLWSFGDGNTSEQFEPLHRYVKYGNYNVSLKVYSEKGCSDSLKVLNAFSGSAYYIEFPNAFIPNIGGPSGGVYSSTSDESAQVFHPSFSGVSEYHLKIFSKMGVLIFETNDINVGWDGYFKGQLSNPGVYIWKVRGNFSNGEPFTKMGDVTLLRN
jgi:PKD repeat protein